MIIAYGNKMEEMNHVSFCYFFQRNLPNEQFRGSLGERQRCRL